MFGSKFAKGIILGISITLLSSGIAFADAGSGQSAAAVTRPSLGKSVVNEDVLKKQQEIDLYLFDQHRDEIAQKGFTVTHTAPIDNYVEIGITPFNEANADYLYKVFGKDIVKVVEGVQAMTMTAAAIPPDAPVSSPAMANSIINEGGEGQQVLPKRMEEGKDSRAELYIATDAATETRDAAQKKSSMPIVLASAAGAAILGGTAILARRSRTAGR